MESCKEVSLVSWINIMSIPLLSTISLIIACLTRLPRPRTLLYRSRELLMQRAIHCYTVLNSLHSTFFSSFLLPTNSSIPSFFQKIKNKIHFLHSKQHSRIVLIDNEMGAHLWSRIALKFSQIGCQSLEDFVVQILTHSDIIWLGFEAILCFSSFLHKFSSQPVDLLDFHWIRSNFQRDLRDLPTKLTSNADQCKEVISIA